MKKVRKIDVPKKESKKELKVAAYCRVNRPHQHRHLKRKDERVSNFV